MCLILFSFFVSHLSFSYLSFSSLCYRENDSLLGQLSQSMMRSEEVPIALAALKVRGAN